MSRCQVELEDLISTTRTKLGRDTHITVSQVLPRTDWTVYNRKAADFNQRIARFCEQAHNVHFVSQPNLTDASNRFDGIHLKEGALAKLVVNLKVVLNQLLGMATYTVKGYTDGNKNTDSNSHGARYNSSSSSCNSSCNRSNSSNQKSENLGQSAQEKPRHTSESQQGNPIPVWTFNRDVNQHQEQPHSKDSRSIHTEELKAAFVRFADLLMV